MNRVMQQDTSSKLFEISALSKLEAKGFEILDVPILQSADHILDMAGERVRSELFFVDSPKADQYALRYDFTLSLANYYLENFLNFEEKKFVASGSVFRNRPMPKKQEFRQISFEYIGHDNKKKMDAECLGTALDLLHAYPSDALSIEISDVKLAHIILSRLNIPPILRGRLKNALRHPQKFMSLLTKEAKGMISGLDAIGTLPKQEAQTVIETFLSVTGLQHSGMRSMEEVRDRFIKKAEESQEPLLDSETLLAIKHFYELDCPAEALSETLRKILLKCDIDIDQSLHYFEKRLDLLKENGVDISHLHYGSLQRRKPDYYSGFMFSIELQQDHEVQSIGGGGRYDTLFLELGGAEAIPAIGCEIRGF